MWAVIHCLLLWGEPLQPSVIEFTQSNRDLPYGSKLFHNFRFIKYLVFGSTGFSIILWKIKSFMSTQVLCTTGEFNFLYVLLTKLNTAWYGVVIMFLTVNSTSCILILCYVCSAYILQLDLRFLTLHSDNGNRWCLVSIVHSQSKHFKYILELEHGMANWHPRHKKTSSHTGKAEHRV